MGKEWAGAGSGYGPIPTANGPFPTELRVATTLLVVVSMTVTLLLPLFAT
jgi:hypothetical protein